MTNLKTKIWIVSMLAVFMLTPVFALHAMGNELNKADLDLQEQKEKVIQDLIANKEGSNGSNSTAFQQSVADAKLNCENINKTLLSITGNTQGAIWVEGLEYRCGYGPADEVPATTTKPKSFRVTEISNDSNVYIKSIRDTGKPLTKESYTKIKNSLVVENNGFMYWLERIVVDYISLLANLVASVLAGIAILSLTLLDMVLSATTNQAAPAIVHETWVIVRDFMNLAFILALIAMALGTILQRDKYSYKALLPKLILMALLINFSELIATTLISVSDMLINLFSPATTITAYGNQIWKGFITGGDGVAGFFNADKNITSAIGSSITKLIAIVLLIIPIVAISGLMFVRAVGLWFLIMLSPAAFALRVIPRTEEYAQKWWTTFIKYLIWGPVAMFFFRVGFTLIGKAGDPKTLVLDPTINFLFIGGFFYGGFLVAKSTGMMGASAVTSYATKAFNQAKSGARMLGSYTWRGGLARDTVRIGSLGGVSKERAKKIGEGFGKASAWVENKPKQLTEEYMDKPNKERKKLVEKQYRRMQIKNIYDKDLPKEVASSLSPEDIHFLASTGRLNEDKIKAIAEHGGKDSIDALLLAVKDKHIAPGKGGIKSEFEFKSVINTIGAAKWKNAGGKEFELPEKYIEDLANNIEVKATRGFTDAEKEIAKEDPKKAEQMRQEWAADSKNGWKDRKANLPNKYIRRHIEQVRKEAKAEVDREEIVKNIVITDAETTPRAGSGEDRLAARRRAAGMNTPPPPPSPPTP